MARARKLRRAVRVHGHVGVALVRPAREARSLPTRAARLRFPLFLPLRLFEPRILQHIRPPRGCTGDCPTNRAFTSGSSTSPCPTLLHYLLSGDSEEVPSHLHQIAGSVVVDCHAQALVARRVNIATRAATRA